MVVWDGPLDRCAIVEVAAIAGPLGGGAAEAEVPSPPAAVEVSVGARTVADVWGVTAIPVVAASADDVKMFRTAPIELAPDCDARVSAPSYVEPLWAAGRKATIPATTSARPVIARPWCMPRARNVVSTLVMRGYYGEADQAREPL